jgi:hypothetical protein
VLFRSQQDRPVIQASTEPTLEGMATSGEACKKKQKQNPSSLVSAMSHWKLKIKEKAE